MAQNAPSFSTELRTQVSITEELYTVKHLNFRDSEKNTSVFRFYLKKGSAESGEKFVVQDKGEDCEKGLSTDG